MKLQLHQHFDTHMEPSCSLHKVYKPHSPLDRNCINDCSPKGPTWSLCLYKAVVGQGGSLLCHNVTGVTVHGACMVRIAFEDSPEIHPQGPLHWIEPHTIPWAIPCSETKQQKRRNQTVIEYSSHANGAGQRNSTLSESRSKFHYIGSPLSARMIFILLHSLLSFVTVTSSAHQRFLCRVISSSAAISVPHSVRVRRYYGPPGGGGGPSLGDRPPGGGGGPSSLLWGRTGGGGGTWYMHPHTWYEAEGSFNPSYLSLLVHLLLHQTALFKLL